MGKCTGARGTRARAIRRGGLHARHKACSPRTVRPKRCLGRPARPGRGSNAGRSYGESMSSSAETNHATEKRVIKGNTVQPSKITCRFNGRLRQQFKITMKTRREETRRFHHEIKEPEGMENTEGPSKQTTISSVPPRCRLDPLACQRLPYRRRHREI